MSQVSESKWNFKPLPKPNLKQKKFVLNCLPALCPVRGAAAGVRQLQQPLHVHRPLLVLVALEAVLLLLSLSPPSNGVQLDAKLLLLLKVRVAAPAVIVLGSEIQVVAVLGGDSIEKKLWLEFPLEK